MFGLFNKKNKMIDVTPSKANLEGYEATMEWFVDALYDDTEIVGDGNEIAALRVYASGVLAALQGTDGFSVKQIGGNVMLSCADKLNGDSQFMADLAANTDNYLNTECDRSYQIKGNWFLSTVYLKILIACVYNNTNISLDYLRVLMTAIDAVQGLFNHPGMTINREVQTILYAIARKQILEVGHVSPKFTDGMAMIEKF